MGDAYVEMGTNRLEDLSVAFLLSLAGDMGRCGVDVTSQYSDEEQIAFDMRW